MQLAGGRGGTADDVALVGVTKLVSIDIAGCLAELGIHDLGENRPQELWEKAKVLPGMIRWHLIGHLQRNKAERTLPLVHLIHSVDSFRLLTALEQECAKLGRPVDVLLEVNASREPNKHGFAPEELSGLASSLAGLAHVRDSWPDDDGSLGGKSGTVPANLCFGAPSTGSVTQRAGTILPAGPPVDGHVE